MPAISISHLFQEKKQVIVLIISKIWLIFLLPTPIFSQTWQENTQHTFNHISQVSQDRYGNVYVVEQEGVIHQFDSLGRKQNSIYSPPLVAGVTLFEARSTVRFFAFYRDLQSFTLLNRFLTPIENYKFDEEKIRFVRVANLSADNQLWLVDDVDFSIKKFDKNFNNIVLRTPLDLLLKNTDYDINYLCEYQNQLFLNDKNTGIFIFDNLANFKKKIALNKGADSFNFLDEEIYFLENENIRIIHLYNLQERTLSLPTWEGKKIEAKKVLLRNDKLFLFTENQMFFFTK